MTTENSRDLMIEVAKGLIGACLCKLVELNRVTIEQVNGKWRVEFSDERLVPRQMFSAASIDRDGKPVIYIRTTSTLEQLKFAIAHEAIHLAQICAGDLVPEYGRQFWKGTAYPSLQAGNPNYIATQPWEEEAADLQPVILEYLQNWCQKRTTGMKAE
jgi:hypothetical protein